MNIARPTNDRSLAASRRTRTLVAAAAGLALVLGATTGATAQGGVLDPAFGTQGVMFEDAPHSEHFNNMVVGSDGTIVVVGEEAIAQFLARYLPDGSPDPSFGTAGRLTLSGVGSVELGVLALQPDGAVVVCSDLSGGGISTTRVSSSGALDTTFGSAGHAVVSVPGFDVTKAWDLAVQSDGKLLIAGNASTSSGAFVARLTATGQLDTSFGQGGFVFVSSPSMPGSNLRQVFARPGGKVVVVGVGVSYDPYTERGFVQRLNADGSPDLGFGLNGVVELGAFGQIKGAEFLPDGRLALVGSESYGSVSVFRLLADGTADPGLGVEGVVTETFAGPSAGIAYLRGMALQPDGKVVVFGNAYGVDQACLARFDLDGTLDTTWGLPVIGFAPQGYSAPYALRAGPGGKLLLGGVHSLTQQAQVDFGIVRILGQVWTDVGQGLGIGHAGAEPTLSGSGTLLPQSSVTLALEGGAAGSLAYLVLGFSHLDAPFKGGTFVPSLDVVIPLITGAQGDVAVPFTWPAGIPAGLELYLQVWMPGGGPFGWSSTQGVLGLAQ